jgi:hypothetical protein
VTIAPARPNGQATEGTVQTAPSSGVFTIQTPSGSTVTIDTSGSTTYREPGVTNAMISDVGVGDRVGIIGTTSGSSVSATEVLIGAPKPTASFAAAGMVDTTPSQGSFTIKTFSGSMLTVDYDASTTYEDLGVVTPAITDVTMNEFVAVFGTQSGSMVSASEVIVGGGHRGGMGGFFGFGRGRGLGPYGSGRSGRSANSASSALA